MDDKIQNLLTEAVAKMEENINGVNFLKEFRQQFPETSKSILDGYIPEGAKSLFPKEIVENLREINELFQPYFPIIAEILVSVSKDIKNKSIVSTPLATRTFAITALCFGFAVDWFHNKEEILKLPDDPLSDLLSKLISPELKTTVLMEEHSRSYSDTTLFHGTNQMLLNMVKEIAPDKPAS